MGGALVFDLAKEGGLLHEDIRGVLLLAPMCKIDDSLRPPEWQVKVLEWLAWLFPTAPITPIPSVTHKAIKCPDRLAQATVDPQIYRQKPRLQTALVMRAVTDRIGVSMTIMSHLCRRPAVS